MKKYFFNGQEVIFSEPYKDDKGFRSGTAYWIKTYPQQDDDARNHELEVLKTVASCRGVPKNFESGTVTVVSEDGSRLSRPAIKEEYLGGMDIKQYCAAHFSETESIIALFTKLAQSFEAIEDETGVIHNDIKSENILIHDGSPVIIDFGISKLKDEEVTERHKHFSEGYEAPEKRSRGEVTVRGDIYSFGRVITWCVNQNPRNYRGYPNRLKEIQEKCCRKEPEQRYASFKEVKETFTQFLDSLRQHEKEKAESKKRRKNFIHKIFSASCSGTGRSFPITKMNLKVLAVKCLPFVSALLYAAGIFLILLTLYLIGWSPTPPKGYVPNLKQDISTVVNDIQKNR